MRIGEPSAYFHQTLTFPSKETVYKSAKDRLKKLLDNVHHQFGEMASIYVAQTHKSGGYHFHLLLFFYTPITPKTEQHLKSAMWTAWKKLNAERLNPQANQFIERATEFRDREKTILYFTADYERAPRDWWGARNRKLINAHQRSENPATVSEILRSLTIKACPPSQPYQEAVPHAGAQKHTLRGLRNLRAYLETSRGEDWAEFKKREMKSSRPVSDKALLDFWNGSGKKPDKRPVPDGKSLF